MRARKLLIRALALLLALMPGLACAAQLAPAEICDTALSAACAGMDLQVWADQALVDGIGSTSDWYIQGLRTYDPAIDMTAIADALKERLVSGGFSSPVTNERAALLLVSCGRSSDVPNGLADESIGVLGIMSYIYGLHMLRNGLASEKWSVDSVCEQLLSLQLDDGGWCVRGESGDTDVTAMCLQALAPVTQHAADRLAAVERALDFLSGAQLVSGGYQSFGTENCESSAQVLIALNTCGIDAAANTRFIKNGRSVIDALREYRLLDGSFAHTPGGESNASATAQAFCAFVDLTDATRDFYDLATMPTSAPNNALRLDYRFWALGAVALIALLALALTLRKPGARGKRALFILALAAAACTLILLTDIQSASGYYSGKPVADGSGGTVYLSIRCDTVAGRADDGSTPADGCILPRTVFRIAAGDSVYDLLTQAAREHSLQLEHTGASAAMAYINGINYLYEYTYGDLSGWMYSVNGEYPSVGCGSCLLKDKDEVVWAYTTDLGEDIQ